MQPWLTIILTHPNQQLHGRCRVRSTDSEGSFPANDYQNQAGSGEIFILISETPCTRSRLLINSQRKARPLISPAPAPTPAFLKEDEEVRTRTKHPHRHLACITLSSRQEIQQIIVPSPIQIPEILPVFGHHFPAALEYMPPRITGRKNAWTRTVQTVERELSPIAARAIDFITGKPVSPSSTACARPYAPRRSNPCVGASAGTLRALQSSRARYVVKGVCTRRACATSMFNIATTVIPYARYQLALQALGFNTASAHALSSTWCSRGTHYVTSGFQSAIASDMRFPDLPTRVQNFSS